MTPPPDIQHGVDTPTLAATISGWVTAIIGFVWTGGKHAQKFQQQGEDIAELKEGIKEAMALKTDLAEMKTDIRWLREQQEKKK